MSISNLFGVLLVVFIQSTVEAAECQADEMIDEYNEAVNNMRTSISEAANDEQALTNLLDNSDPYFDAFEDALFYVDTVTEELGEMQSELNDLTNKIEQKEQQEMDERRKWEEEMNNKEEYKAEHFKKILESDLLCNEFALKPEVLGKLTESFTHVDNIQRMEQMYGTNPSISPIDRCKQTSCWAPTVNLDDVVKKLEGAGVFTGLRLPGDLEEASREEGEQKAKQITKMECETLLQGAAEAHQLFFKASAEYMSNERMGGCKPLCEKLSDKVPVLLKDQMQHVTATKQKLEELGKELFRERKEKDLLDRETNKCDEELKKHSRQTIMDKDKELKELIEKLRTTEQKRKDLEQKRKKMEEEQQITKSQKKAAEETIKTLKDLLDRGVVNKQELKPKTVKIQTDLSELETKMEEIRIRLKTETTNHGILEPLKDSLDTIREKVGEIASTMTKIHTTSFAPFRGWLDQGRESLEKAKGFNNDGNDELNLCDDEQKKTLKRCQWWVNQDGRTHILMSPLQAGVQWNALDPTQEELIKYPQIEGKDQGDAPDVFKKTKTILNKNLKDMPTKRDAWSAYAQEFTNIENSFPGKLQAEVSGLDLGEEWKGTLKEWTQINVYSLPRAKPAKKPENRRGAVDICEAGDTTLPWKERIAKIIENVQGVVDSQLGYFQELDSKVKDAESASEEKVDRQLKVFEATFSSIHGMKECLDFYKYAVNWQSGKTIDTIYNEVKSALEENQMELEKENQKELTFKIKGKKETLQNLENELTSLEANLAQTNNDKKEWQMTIEKFSRLSSEQLEGILSFGQQIEEQNNLRKILLGSLGSLLQKVGKADIVEMLTKYHRQLSLMDLHRMSKENGETAAKMVRMSLLQSEHKETEDK